MGGHLCRELSRVHASVRRCSPRFLARHSLVAAGIDLTCASSSVASGKLASGHESTKSLQCLKCQWEIAL